MPNKIFKDDLSKSELFELSGEFSNDSSQLDDANSLELSNLELDVSLTRAILIEFQLIQVYFYI